MKGTVDESEAWNTLCCGWEVDVRIGDDPHAEPVQIRFHSGDEPLWEIGGMLTTAEILALGTWLQQLQVRAEEDREVEAIEHAEACRGEVAILTSDDDLDVVDDDGEE